MKLKDVLLIFNRSYTSKEQLEEFVDGIDERVSKLMDVFWPGPISFILPLKTGYLCEKLQAD